MEKIGAEGTSQVDVPTVSGPEVDASVLGLFGDPKVVFFDLVIMHKKKYDIQLTIIQKNL